MIGSRDRAGSRCVHATAIGVHRNNACSLMNGMKTPDSYDDYIII
jgi:hypothetical protein